MDAAFAFELLSVSLRDLCDAFNQDRFKPLLEADVTAYLYHRLLVNGCPPLLLYNETRVCGIARARRKYDLVIGAVSTSRACVNPVLIAEVKCFQRWGHTPQQHRRRFEGIIDDDLEALRESSAVLGDGQRVEVVVDFVHTPHLTGYLSGTWNRRIRRDVLVELCQESGISLLWARPDRQGKLEVEQLV